MNGNILDLTGQRFGKLTAIEPVPERHHLNVVWRLRCDCGNEVLLPARVLTYRPRFMRSCGCSPQRRRPHRKPWRIALNARMGIYRIRAKKRGLVFGLSFDQFARLALQRCRYCGARPRQKYYSLPHRCYYNGLDRVDNALGYTPGNVVPCCKICNRAKSTLSVEEFRQWATHLSSHFLP